MQPAKQGHSDPRHLVRVIIGDEAAVLYHDARGDRWSDEVTSQMYVHPAAEAVGLLFRITRMA